VLSLLFPLERLLMKELAGDHALMVEETPDGIFAKCGLD
jgi:hypothetical protein